MLLNALEVFFFHFVEYFNKSPAQLSIDVAVADTLGTPFLPVMLSESIETVVCKKKDNCNLEIHIKMAARIHF